MAICTTPLLRSSAVGWSVTSLGAGTAPIPHGSALTLLVLLSLSTQDLNKTFIGLYRMSCYLNLSHVITRWPELRQRFYHQNNESYHSDDKKTQTQACPREQGSASWRARKRGDRHSLAILSLLSISEYFTGEAPVSQHSVPGPQRFHGDPTKPALPFSANQFPVGELCEEC